MLVSPTVTPAPAPCLRVRRARGLDKSTAYSPVGTNLPAPQPPPRWRRPTLVMSGAACARCRWSYTFYHIARGRLLPVPDHVAQKIREGPWRPRDARARHHGSDGEAVRVCGASVCHEWTEWWRCPAVRGAMANVGRLVDDGGQSVGSR